MSAGLEASTVTPGSTAPDASLTVPTMDPCANAAAGIRTRRNAAEAFRKTGHTSAGNPFNDGYILLLGTGTGNGQKGVYQRGVAGRNTYFVASKTFQVLIARTLGR